MQYEPVIGLEVHVELNTKTKMFCRCSADYFGKEANTHTCPICLGLPGSLPFINEKAIEYCIKIGLALNCKVAEKSLFERKNYFYPDLPKGYQISQYRWPICVDGWLEVASNDGESASRRKKIRINRVHQEEDTGKLSHIGGVTNIDFNRSGVPLVEIVTEPDFTDTEQVRDYTKKIQQIVRYLGVSNADMEKGDMRLEANISLRKLKTQNSKLKRKELPNYRIELKNINSFRFMVAAIEYEIKRQTEALEKGEKLVQETRGWDEDKKRTYLQRSKEEAHDYRYFLDPDLPELRVKSLESRVQEKMPELPDQKAARFVKDYGLDEARTKILTEVKELADYFEETARLGQKRVEAKQIANYLINQKVDISKVNGEEMIRQILSKKVGMIEDIEELEELVKGVIEENPKFMEDYRKGKVAVLQALIGAVMKKSAGKADVMRIKEILGKLLNI